MKRIVIAAFALASPLLHGEAPRASLPAPSDPAIDAAEQAMAARLPQVAIAKLNDFLTSSAALDDALRERAEQDLTHAMLDSGDTVGGLARLEYPSSPAERFWKAEALSSLGRWDDAASLYAEAITDGPPKIKQAATLGEAEAFHALGEDDRARLLLARLEARSPSTLVRLRLAELYLDGGQLDPARKLLARATPGTLLETRWRQYVEGRVYLAEDQPAPALEDFEGLLNDPRGLTQALQYGATVGLTDARIALNGREVADQVIENYIAQYPESPYLEDMFRRLDAIYSAEDSPSETEYQQWAARPPARRAALALFYEAQLLQHQRRPPEKAIRFYSEFIQRYPGHAFAFEAWMQLGELYLETSRVPTAINAFEGAMRCSGTDFNRARAEIATGNAHFAQGDFLLAVESFHDAAARTPELWLKATYDSALAWLNIGNYDRFLEDYTALSQRYPDTRERRNLLLEEGLLQARSGDAHAAATLESFIRDFPDNRRIAEAQLALAELGYARGDMDAASQYLKAAYVSSPSHPSKEQADYLAVFIADSKPHRDEEDVLRLSRAFLESYPNSQLRPQVRMKMGEVYFRREDFANAQTQFETLAQESPSDPLADKALILAGQSSVNSMSGSGAAYALTLFGKVAEGNGPLKLYARQEQALLELRLGHAKDALILYDEILRSAPDTALRLAALCGKADCLVAMANDAYAAPSPAPGGSPSPSAADTFASAIGLYDQISSDPDVTTPWYDQALFKKGECLEKQGFMDQALAAFYDVLDRRSTATRKQPDYFWYEKAGFEAATMLEAKSQWPGAISIMEKIAQAGGPRSAEARKQADQLRLEHFVWE